MSFVKCFGFNLFGGISYPKVQPQYLVSTKLPKQVPSPIADGQFKHYDDVVRLEKDTVYVIRMHTGDIVSRPAAVNLCLLAEDGTTIIHRVESVYQHKQPQEQMKQICSVVSADCGAACDLVLSQPYKKVYTGQPVLKERFRANSLDEVFFVGPELGDIAGILVGPEAGAWQLNEVEVTSSRSQKIHHFRCQERLGEGGLSAMYLTPVSPDAIVYGEGQSAIEIAHPEMQQMVTKLQIQLENKLNAQEFDVFENRVRIACAFLALSSCGVLNIAGSSEAAAVFGISSLVGATQCLILEQIPREAVNNWIRILLPLWNPEYKDDGVRLNSQRWITKETRLRNFYFRLSLYSSFLLSSLYLLVNPQVFNTDPTQFITQTQMSVVGWVGFLHYISCKWFLESEDALHVARANIGQQKQA